MQVAEFLFCRIFLESGGLLIKRPAIPPCVPLFYQSWTMLMALLLGCKKADILRLQRLQNKAARIIFQVPKMHSSSEHLSTLHWLPVDKLIIFKTLLYIYKALNDRAPVYLSNSISIFIPTREGLRSSMDILRLDVPRSNRQYGLRSFSQFGPSLWNKVPLAIRTSPTDTVFKKKLKTHLF